MHRYVTPRIVGVIAVTIGARFWIPTSSIRRVMYPVMSGVGTKPSSSLPTSAGKTVGVLQLVVMDPLCFSVEIYKTDNPRMNMSTCQLFIPWGWWSGARLWKSLLWALKVKPLLRALSNLLLRFFSTDGFHCVETAELCLSWWLMVSHCDPCFSCRNLQE